MEKPRNRQRFRPNKRSDVVNFGGVLPHALDLEKALLGAMIADSSNEVVQNVIALVQARYFYAEVHQLVFQAIEHLVRDASCIDLLTVTEQMRKEGTLEKAGGAYGITLLTSRVSSGANADFWFRIIYQKYVMREIIRIGHEKVTLAYEDMVDCFDLLTRFISDLSSLKTMPSEALQGSTESLIDQMIAELSATQNDASHTLKIAHSPLFTGWPRFDRVVTLTMDKIILIAGAAKSGKSKFIRSMMYRLLETYEFVSVCWVTLEDSRQDLFLSYLASKLFFTAKQIRLKQYPAEMVEAMKQHSSRYKTFDIEFIDQSIKSDQITVYFSRFCETRKGRFNILVVDNILSLDDQSDFKFDPNGFCNHVMQNLLKCRRQTHGLIIALHHFNDAQQDKENLQTGYRPVLKDMKGSETFRRTPNQVLLINSFNIYKDLMAEYDGEKQRLLSKLFIVDTGANREDSIEDRYALIHFFCEMAYDLFSEIPLQKQI